MWLILGRTARAEPVQVAVMMSHCANTLPAAFADVLQFVLSIRVHLRASLVALRKLHEHSLVQLEGARKGTDAWDTH